MDSIDLRPEKADYDITSPSMSGDSCPSVYLRGGKELADLPKEGTITFRFKRSELSMRDGEKKPVTLVLSLKSIEDAEDGGEIEEESEGVDDEDPGEALDKKFSQAINDEEIED